MRKAGLLHCTDCAGPRFDGLRRRNQLPFDTDDDAAVGWQTFTLRDAFDLRLMLDLVDENGAAIEEALYIVGNALAPGRHLHTHPLNPPRSEGDLWAGAVLLREVDGDEVTFSRFHFAGRLEDFPPRIVAEKAKHEAQYPSKLEVVRLIAANASRAAEFVRQRALDIGLPEGTDFSAVWPSEGAD